MQKKKIVEHAARLKTVATVVFLIVAYQAHIKPNQVFIWQKNVSQQRNFTFNN